MKTTDFVKGKWSQIFEFYGLPPVTRGHHYKGECPICGKKGKFRIDDKDGSGSYICVCGAGNGWKLLTEVTGKDFKTLAKEIDNQFGNVYENNQSTPAPDLKTDNKLNQAIAKAKAANKIKGTNVERYLNSRGVFELPKKGVVESNGNMFAIATDFMHRAVFSHETFLDGDKKADVSIQKKMIGLTSEGDYIDGVAIRMFAPSSTLGIAEGIETALSCRQIYHCSIWSTLNSGFMKKFRAPEGVNHLMVFADNDNNGTGLAAAFECGRANILAKNDVEKVTIRWPGDVCDFNDMLNNGSQVFEWVLTK